MIKKSNYEHELDALGDLVSITSACMEMKLQNKWAKGYQGWDNPENKRFIYEKLLRHMEEASENSDKWIDVMNLAAMLWNFEQ